jgi:hypothetical protein
MFAPHSYKICILTLQSDEKSEASKKVIMQRVGGYMTRAEELKTLIARQNSPAAPAPVAAAAPKYTSDLLGHA